MRRQKRRPFRVWFLTLALGLTAACSAPLGLRRDEDAPVQTRALSYTLVEGENGFAARVDITYTFRNVSEARVLLLGCAGLPNVILQRLEDGSWVNEWPAAWFSCTQGPFATVEPGDMWRGSVRLEGGAPGCGCVPGFSARPEGVRRIVLVNAVHGFAEVAGFGFRGALIPLAQRVSNRFQLRVR